MGTLIFVCPTTGHQVSTGVEVDRSSYRNLPRTKTAQNKRGNAGPRPRRITCVSWYRNWYRTAQDKRSSREIAGVIGSEIFLQSSPKRDAS